jgi:hypothetical protein
MRGTGARHAAASSEIVFDGRGEDKKKIGGASEQADGSCGAKPAPMAQQAQIMKAAISRVLSPAPQERLTRLTCQSAQTAPYFTGRHKSHCTPTPQRGGADRSISR